MNGASILTIFLIAFSLSIDAFVVSIAAGLAMKKILFRHALRISFMFGLFQAIMPIIGWFSGTRIRDLLESIDYFVVTGIFFFIGVKMVIEALLFKKEKERDYTDIKIIFILAVATSIDAFAAGLGFSIIHAAIILPVIIIGSVTFFTSFIGVYIGNMSGKLFGNGLGIAGGILLMGLAVKFFLKALEVV